MVQLEVGKSYRTRDGRNTGPLVRDHVYYRAKNIKIPNTTSGQKYHADGRVFRMEIGEENDTIVAEWVSFEVGKTYQNVTDPGIKVIVDFIGVNPDRAYAHSLTDPTVEVGIVAADWEPLKPVVIEQVKHVFYSGGDFYTQPEEPHDTLGRVKFILTNGKLSVEVIESDSI